MISEYFNNLVSMLVSRLLLKQVNGIENIPKQGGYIVAANHISYLDILVEYAVFLAKAGAFVRFIAKKELLKDKFFKTFTFLFENKYNKVILLDISNPEKAFEEAIATLKKGCVIGIYPEGGRSPDGKIQKGKSGVIRLALSAKSPIVPVGIKGTFELMPDEKSMPKIRKIVTVNIGKPVYLNNYYSKKITKKILRELKDNVMREITKLTRQKYNY